MSAAREDSGLRSGAESFGEAEGPTGSTPGRNSHLPLEQSSDRSSRGNGNGLPDDDDSDHSSSSLPSSGTGGWGGGSGNGNDPNGIRRFLNRRRKKIHRKG